MAAVAHNCCSRGDAGPGSHACQDSAAAAHQMSNRLQVMLLAWEAVSNTLYMPLSRALLINLAGIRDQMVWLDSGQKPRWGTN